MSKMLEENEEEKQEKGEDDVESENGVRKMYYGGDWLDIGWDCGN